MPKFFDTREFVKLLTASGFVKKNQEGSHAIYECPNTGISTVVPIHSAGVSVGVGENIIKTIILNEHITGQELLSQKNKFSNNVNEVAKKHYKKVEGNKMFLLPDYIRIAQKIDNEADTMRYLDQKISEFQQKTNNK